MDINYTRVIPRDLFNEAKLLKCIGRLCLLIHDRQTVEGLTFEHDDKPFKIGLLDEGALTIKNIIFDLHGERLMFQTTYNSKCNWPLFCVYDYCEYLVFDEAGQHTQEFLEFCKTITDKSK